MDFFKKDKMPSKKAANKGKGKNLSKYLPTTLFIGVQEDVNEKALIGYITSLSQSAFNNLKEVKYSTKKLGKNRFIYEIHNGAQDLTYLPLVISNLIEGTDKEIILKTQSQNVRVIKKTVSKIESNTLISSNNRDEDAQVDLQTKGKLKSLIKQGTEILIFSIIASSITGVLAGASFFSKYYMLNEDYSYNPNVPKIETPYEFLQKLSKEDHTKDRYLNNIRFQNKKWKTNYIENENENIISSEISANSMSENNSNGGLNDIKPENIVKDDVVKENNVQISNSSILIENKKDEVRKENRDERRARIMERRKQKEKERRERRKERERMIEMENSAEPSLMDDALISNELKTKETDVISKKNITNEANVMNNMNTEMKNNQKNNEVEIIEEEPVEATVNKAEPLFENINDSNEVEPIIEKTEAIVDEVEIIENTEAVVDEFEIVEEIAIDSLDLSNLPDNVILEEGVK